MGWFNREKINSIIPFVNSGAHKPRTSSVPQSTMLFRGIGPHDQKIIADEGESTFAAKVIGKNMDNVKGLKRL
jgi:hypothetical protein